MKAVFNTYTTKKGEPENGYWEILQYLEGLKEKDLLVRVDIGKKAEYSLDEEDFFFPSLKISHLKLEKLDERKFSAEFDTKDLRNVFVFLLKLGEHGNGGHSYEVLIGKKSFYIDGDGADHLVSINDVPVNKISKSDAYHWSEIYNKDINKDTMKITESQLKQLVVESLKNVLKESADEWVENPYPIDDEDNNGVDRVTPGDSLPMGCGNDKPGPDMFNPKYNSPKELKLNQLRSTIVNTLRNYEQSKQSYKLADVAADLSKRYGVPYENVLSSLVKSYKFHDCHYADDEYEVMSKIKKPVRLKESELRNLIKNAVIGVLNESVAADDAK